MQVLLLGGWRCHSFHPHPHPPIELSHNLVGWSMFVLLWLHKHYSQLNHRYIGITSPFTQYFIFILGIFFKKLNSSPIHIKLSSACVNLLLTCISTLGSLPVFLFLKKLPLALSPLLQFGLLAFQACCTALGLESIFTINLRTLLAELVLSWYHISWILCLPLSWLVLLFGQEHGLAASCVESNIFETALKKFLYAFLSSVDSLARYKSLV